MAGRPVEARAAVAEGLRMATAGPPDPALASLAAAGLRVEADAADRARARYDEPALGDARRRSRSLIGEVERLAAQFGIPLDGASGGAVPSRSRALAALCRAEARRLEQRDDAATWLAVAGEFDAIGRPYPAAYARFRAGATTLRDRGSRVEATTILAAARVTASELGAGPLLGEIDLLARHARLEIAPSAATTRNESVDGVATTIDLTPREVEVLRLIAAGWSNQQIAQSLFITRKTASVHASHIFDKLGAANRVEAAAIAHRIGLDVGAPPPGSDAPGV